MTTPTTPTERRILSLTASVELADTLLNDATLLYDRIRTLDYPGEVEDAARTTMRGIKSHRVKLKAECDRLKVRERRQARDMVSIWCFLGLSLAILMAWVMFG